jgi:hypothetical protein
LSEASAAFLAFPKNLKHVRLRGLQYFDVLVDMSKMKMWVKLCGLTVSIWAITLLINSTQAVAQTSNRLVLITPQEAQLPPAANVSLTMRAGITRGPKILLASPQAEVGSHSPIHFQVKFESFGGAKVDPASVKVTYLKTPSVDLTDRLKPLTQLDGIDVNVAEVPPGIHNIRVDVKDSDGRAGTANFTLKVSE